MIPGDHYGTLGLNRDATRSEIKSAHRRLLLKTHPDKTRDLIGEKRANDVQTKVNAANEVLGSESLKAEYDKFRGVAFHPLYRRHNLDVTLKEKFFQAYRHGKINEDDRVYWNREYQAHLRNIM